jgi:hypothetical protein
MAPYSNGCFGLVIAQNLSSTVPGYGIIRHHAWNIYEIFLFSLDYSIDDICASIRRGSKFWMEVFFWLSVRIQDRLPSSWHCFPDQGHSGLIPRHCRKSAEAFLIQTTYKDTQNACTTHSHSHSIPFWSAWLAFVGCRPVRSQIFELPTGCRFTIFQFLANLFL